MVEKAGGYYYNDSSKNYNRNRFIYWRTNGDTLDLSEISLDVNLIDSSVQYKFTDAPILSVSIAERNEHIIVMVATVNSLHQLKFSHPNRLQKNLDETQSFSVFHDACTGQLARDSTASLFYVIAQATASSKQIKFCSFKIANFNGKIDFFYQISQFHILLHAH